MTRNQMNIIFIKLFRKSHNIKKGRKTSIFDRHESSKRIRSDSESQGNIFFVILTMHTFRVCWLFDIRDNKNIL